MQALLVCHLQPYKETFSIEIIIRQPRVQRNDSYYTRMFCFVYIVTVRFSQLLTICVSYRESISGHRSCQSRTANQSAVKATITRCQTTLFELKQQQYKAMPSVRVSAPGRGTAACGGRRAANTSSVTVYGRQQTRSLPRLTNLQYVVMYRLQS